MSENDGSQEPVFRKSTYSGAGNSNCVELADSFGGVLVRDSKNVGKGAIRLSGRTAAALLECLRR